jgi:hypothetical protein
MDSVKVGHFNEIINYSVGWHICTQTQTQTSMFLGYQDIHTSKNVKILIVCMQ